ncbi:MAG TPA: outer membrane beta-barrel protein [Ferrovibrio sp.]|uniref:outer membrane beta-barrel protein n=1 Tax=Ferrovibrio sp. TaxID=1917215 RepID=UPI002ED40708
MLARKLLVSVAIPIAVSAFSAIEVKAQTATPPAQTNPAPLTEEVPRGQTVMERPRPDYDPIGIRLGGFMLLPGLTVGESYNSNIFATENNTQDDFITTIQPSANLRSNWNNHALNFHADSSIERYADHSSEDIEDYTLTTDGRLDVLHDLRLYGGAGYLRRHEARSSPDNVSGSTERARYDDYQATAGIEKVFNRLSTRLDGQFDRFRYGDVTLSNGTVSDLSDRDRDQTQVSLRTGYELAPLRQVYLLGAYNWRNYDSEVNSGFDRDSTGYLLAVGADYDIDGVTFLEGYVGYRVQDYDDPALKSLGGWASALKLTWNVTRLTTVTGTLSRTVEETTVSNASGYFSTKAEVRADHELLRNLILNASLAYQNDDFEGVSRTDNYYLASIGAQYLMNRYLSLSGGYGYRTRNSDQSGADFDENVVFLRVTGHL